MKDERIREYIFAKRIVSSENIRNVQALLREKELQPDFVDNDEVVLEENSNVILDFGRELHGSVLFVTRVVDDKEDNKVRIRLGESVSEACSELHGATNATNDHSLRDICTQLVDFSAMEFCQSGFRFVRIDNVGKGKLHVRAIVAVSVMRDLHPLGSFRCDDALVNEIFDTASRTLMLNMQTYLWDGIKRDRMVWVGDMQPEVLGITCLFGQNDIVSKSLDFAKNQYPAQDFINWMPAYSLWYIVIVHDYGYQAGDLSLWQSNLDYITSVVDVFDEKIGDDGKLNFYAFLDWPTNETADAESGVDGLCYMAMNCAKEILSRYGRDTSVCESVIGKILRKKHDVSWAKQSASLLVYSGLVSAKQMHDFIVSGGAKGMSTFMSYFILTAVAMSGDYATALQMLKQYYGGMLSVGATSFWEDFDVDWLENSAPIDDVVPEGRRDIHGENGRFCYVGLRHSLCHGWSCGPVQYLLHNVAGFKVLDVGGSKLSVCPHLQGLQYVDASYPTIYGVVSVHAENRNGTTFVKVDAPSGVQVICHDCVQEQDKH